ncbi:hypothetical protein KPATCC21470_6889 [Kitasatospora purpeofusca]
MTPRGRLLLLLLLLLLQRRRALGCCGVVRPDGFVGAVR